MQINGILAYLVCSILIASGILLINPSEQRFHPDIEARRTALLREIRDSWRCLRNAGALGAIPDILKPVQTHTGCYAGADFEFSGRAAFEVDAAGKLKASPMAVVRLRIDALTGTEFTAGIAKAWAAETPIHQFFSLTPAASAFIQRSIQYGDHAHALRPGERRTQRLLSALVTAVVAPELATRDGFGWQADGTSSTLVLRDGDDALRWACGPTAAGAWRCTTEQAELVLAGQASIPRKLVVELSNWQSLNMQNLPRDWVLSWGDEGWIEYRGRLESVRRAPPPVQERSIDHAS